jgi:hypothetical protein
VVERLMAKAPADRYQTAADALADLRRRGEEGAPGSRPRPSSAIVSAPDLGRLPALPAEPRGWRNLLDRVQGRLGRYAPGFVQHLQSTTRQVDGALVGYEERRRELAGLISDAEVVAADLAAQARDNKAAAAAAERRATAALDEESRQLARREQEDCAERARSLDAQVAEQEEELSQMRLNLAQIDTTLRRLRGQRDVLLARLRVVRARERLEKGRPRGRRRVFVVAAGSLLAVLLVVGAVVALWRPARPQIAEHFPATEPAPQATPKDTGAELPPPPPLPFVELQRFEKHEGRAARAVFVPNTDLILTGGGGNGTAQPLPASHFPVRLWDRKTGKEVRRFEEQHKAGVIGLAVSADGGRALSSSGGSEGLVCLWDVATGHCLHAMRGHQGAVAAVTFTPDGKRAISGGGRDGTIRAWDLAKGEQLDVKFTGHDRGVNCLVCLPGQRLVSGGGDGAVRLHDLDTGRQLALLQADAVPISGLGVVDGGKKVLSCSTDGTVRVWDVAGQAVLRQFVSVAHPNHIFSAAFSPDGRRLLIAPPDGTVRLWDVAAWRELQLSPTQAGRVGSVTFAPDGRAALLAGWDGVVRLWGPAPK